MPKQDVRYAALLRGINVGRAKRVAMADLRKLLKSLGLGTVATLLNSGNAVFSGVEEPTSTLAQRIQTAVLDQLGVDAQVLVKTDAEVDIIIQDNPLQDCNDPSRLLVVNARHAVDLEPLRSLRPDPDGRSTCALGRHAAYIWCPDGLLKSPLATAALRELGDRVTSRNWATMLKLQAMLRG